MVDKTIGCGRPAPKRPQPIDPELLGRHHGDPKVRGCRTRVACWLLLNQEGKRLTRYTEGHSPHLFDMASRPPAHPRQLPIHHLTALGPSRMRLKGPLVVIDAFDNEADLGHLHGAPVGLSYPVPRSIVVIAPWNVDGFHP